MASIKKIENINVGNGGIAKTNFIPDGTTPVGVHKIKGTYIKNDEYNEKTSELQDFIVNRPTTTSITNYVGSTDEELSLVADVTCDGFTVNVGIVQFKVAGTIIGTANVTNGKAIFDYTVACANESTLQAIYLGNDGNFGASESSLAKIDVRHGTNLYVQNVTLNKDVNLYVEGNATYTDDDNNTTLIPTGAGTFFIDGVKYGDITITNGKFTLTGQLPNYTPGAKQCKVTFTQTDDYEAAEYNFTITVRHPTTITVRDIPATKGETVDVSVTVKDESSNIVTEGTVEFNINGEIFTASVVNGVATQSYQVPANQTTPISYTAQFMESTNYSRSSSESARITLRKDVSITVDNQTVNVGDNVTLVARVTCDDEPVTTGEVEFEIVTVE